MNGMVVGFDDVFADGEAKTTAGGVAAAALGGAEEAFENTADIFFGNAHAIIGDLYQDIVFIGIVHAGHHGASKASVFDGIIQQVADHLADLFLIGINHNGLFASFF